MTLREHLKTEIGNNVCIGSTGGGGFFFIGKVEDYEATCAEIEQIMELIQLKRKNLQWRRISKDYKTSIDMRNRLLIRLEDCDLELKGFEEIEKKIDERIEFAKKLLVSAREMKSKKRCLAMYNKAVLAKEQIEQDKATLREEMVNADSKLSEYAFTLKDSKLYMKKLDSIYGEPEKILDNDVVNIYNKQYDGKAIIVSGTATGYWHSDEKNKYLESLQECAREDV